MAVNPATIQNTTYQYPNYQPRFMDNFATLANAYLQGRAQKQTMDQEAVQKAFAGIAPQWAAEDRLRPGGQTNIGGVKYPFTINDNPQPQWNKMATMYRAMLEQQKFENPGMESASAADANARAILSTDKTFMDNKTSTAKKAKMLQDMRAVFSRGQAQSQPTVSDESGIVESAVAQYPSKSRAEIIAQLKKKGLISDAYAESQ